MEEKDAAALRSERQRRKRVSKIRNGIVATVAIWMLVSAILIVTLLVKVISLEHRLNTLTMNPAYSSQIDANQNTGTGDGKDSLESIPDTQSNSEESKVSLVSGMDEPDNLAKEGDVHKVYLTFEDGPSENTAAILDTLNQYQVKATFFVVGKEDDESKALYKRIVDEGHTLGMHSYSNKYSTIYESREAFEADFKELQDYLYELTGVESSYYRFPGGSNNQISNVDMSEFIQYLNSQGVTYYDWNVSAGDATSMAYTSEDIVANVTENIVKYKTSVVLLHDADDKSATVDALGPLIEALQNMGAEILPIDEDTTVIQSVKIAEE